MADTLNVTIVEGHDRIAARIPEWTEETGVRMHNKNQSHSSFFMVNDHVFMMVNNDCPHAFASEWIPYYAEKCSAFFVLQYRFSTIPLFENAPIPVFPLPMQFHPTIPGWYLEQQSRLALDRERDIPIFFSGRKTVRARREEIFKMLPQHYPKAILNDVQRNMLTPRDYCDFMCRAKIAWCPRSVYCNPDREENGITSKECDAMCAQAMVIRHALHVKETEPRTAGVHFVEIEPEEEDLLAKLEYYLSNDGEREEIAYNGRRWYERNWSPTAQSHYLVNRCFEAMGEPFEAWPH